VIDGLDCGVVVTSEDGVTLYANPEGRRCSVARADGIERRRIRFGTRESAVLVDVFRDRTALDARLGELERSTARHAALVSQIGLRIEAERETMRINEIVRASQDLHDILGHSMTLVIAQLESLKLVADAEGKRSRLEVVRGIVRQGIDEYERNLARAGTAAFLKVSPLLSKLADQARAGGVEIEVIVKGTEPPMDPSDVSDVYSICRECVTNSIRHGKAGRILVSLDFTNGTRLLVIDDGQGCASIDEGTGLKGIRKRAERIGADVTWLSSPHEGFTVRLSLR